MAAGTRPLIDRSWIVRWLTTALNTLESVRFLVLGLGDQQAPKTTPLWNLSLEGLSVVRSERGNTDGYADIATAELTLMLVPANRESLTGQYEMDEAVAMVEAALDDVRDRDAASTHELVVRDVSSEWRLANIGEDRTMPIAQIVVTCWVKRESGRTIANHNP